MRNMNQTARYTTLPDRVFVSNAGQVMDLWHTGRLRLLAADIRKTRDVIHSRQGGGSPHHIVRMIENDVAKFMQEGARKWRFIRPTFTGYLHDYLGGEEGIVPSHMDEMHEYLCRLTIDVQALGKGTLSERQRSLLRVAAFGGAWKADIAVAAAHAALEQTATSPGKRFLDLAWQVDMMERHALSQRMLMADNVKDDLIKAGCAETREQIKLTPNCTNHDGCPISHWIPALLDGIRH